MQNGWRSRLPHFPVGIMWKQWRDGDGVMEEREGGTNYLQKNLSVCIWVETAPPIPIYSERNHHQQILVRMKRQQTQSFPSHTQKLRVVIATVLVHGVLSKPVKAQSVVFWALAAAVLSCSTESAHCYGNWRNHPSRHPSPFCSSPHAPHSLHPLPLPLPFSQSAISQIPPYSWGIEKNSER